MIGSSGCVAEYDTDNKPKVVSEMKANELFTLSVNEEEKLISDNAVFEGKSATAGDYALFRQQNRRQAFAKRSWNAGLITCFSLLKTALTKKQ